MPNKRHTTPDILTCIGIGALVVAVIGIIAYYAVDAYHTKLFKQCTPDMRIMERPYEQYTEYRAQVYVCESSVDSEGRERTTCGWNETANTRDRTKALSLCP